MPNVQPGNIIEVKYEITSPFIFQFREWKFQSDIPKLLSIYKTSIPGNYRYNIVLKGYLTLDIEDKEVIKDCFGRGMVKKSECGVNYWGMKNVPAFKEEEFMLAPSNFISALVFELSEVFHFNGAVNKYTKTWESVDGELKSSSKFGKQLKRGKEVFKSDLDPLLANEKNPLNRAKIIYEFIQGYFKWNGYYNIYSEYGIKKAYDEKTGNIADINLSLGAALDFYGFNVYPVLVSTRRNGRPTELHPVLSQFNYIVCYLNIDGKTYLLDASDPYLPFGILPIACMNHKGRVMDFDKSFWIDMAPFDELKKNTTMVLKMDTTGVNGTLFLHGRYI